MQPLKIAVIGSGISGLSAAWLLGSYHTVTLYEGDGRLGGHSNTVDVDGVPVDTGFIVYNEQTYPNLVAFLRHLQVETKPTEMSFSVSLDEGRFEYSGTNLGGLLAQPANVVRPRFWSMLRDLQRFYRDAPADIRDLGSVSLAEYLALRGYGAAFRDCHLFPMAAAIWSTPACDIGAYPAHAFISFFENHGLLKMVRRPIWRTVSGGSRSYIDRFLEDFRGRVELSRPVAKVVRHAGYVELIDRAGRAETFDHVVIATHADQALTMLQDPTRQEKEVLGSFGYVENEAVFHGDPSLMPRRRRVWSSWNYSAAAAGDPASGSVTYWMNRLQSLECKRSLFVTLNPLREPDPSTIIRRERYSHPCYDHQAIDAQEYLWSLQGGRRTWFCGSYFGAGFHEDGLQAGLAVAEALGGIVRPWRIPAESGRIKIRDAVPGREMAYV
jgi:uncharacterized protein